ncbi:MAG TPA: hypothetical protein ENK88_00215 [Campylobacterales bacterium]|nr:hypothetical protein [Campylobacterales bacterium]
MIKLSDYLSYLSNEIAQARKGMDIEAIKRAKEYSEHEYLKYFKAPRFIMPSIKLELPIKISELDSKTTYSFTMNKAIFLERFNERVSLIEQEHNVTLKHLHKDDLEKKEFNDVIQELKDRDYNFIDKVDYSLHKIKLHKPIKPIIEPIRPRSGFVTMDSSTSEAIKHKVDEAFRETLKEQFSPVSATLKDVYIQPDTNSLKKSGDDKILVKLSVELVEESLQIVKLTDTDGKEYEEIIID